MATSIRRAACSVASTASTALNAKLDAVGELIMLPGFRMETIKPEETVVFRTVSGGGYGDPLQRDPERVARDADRGWISMKTARDIYGVALRLAANGLDHEVDQAATAKFATLRQIGTPVMTFRVGIDIGGTFTDCVVHSQMAHRSSSKAPQRPTALPRDL